MSLNEIKALSNMMAAEYDKLTTESRAKVLAAAGIKRRKSKKHIGKYEPLAKTLVESSEENLSSLYDLLFLKERTKSGPDVESGSIWKPNGFRLFLSHANQDKEFVSDVKSALWDTYSIDGFVAHEDIQPTKVWIMELEKALDSCQALACFLTAGFQESYWCNQEIGYCLARKILIIPLRIGIDPFGFIGRYQGAQSVGLSAYDVSAQIFDAIMVNTESSLKMAPALVYRFENSGSFNDAKVNMEFVEKLTAVPSELLFHLRKAVFFNSQVSKSWGVPEKVDDIIEKHGGLNVGIKA